MIDAERDQNVRREVAVHVRVQIGAELELARNIGLENGLCHREAVVRRLAHQRLRDGRDRGLHFHAPVRVDVRDLRVAEPENEHLLVISVDIARHLAADTKRLTRRRAVGFVLCRGRGSRKHMVPVRVMAERETAELREVPDQIAGLVVWRDELIVEMVKVLIEIDDNILFAVEKKACEICHRALLLFGSLRIQSHSRLP